MIKVIYYIGMNDKNTLKQELAKSDFITEFDEIFRDYTIVEASGRFTNKIGEITIERSLTVTTFIDNCNETELRKLIQNNCDILKNKLNQESILVEVCKPEVMFL
nr:MAG TPA: Protein of unknown function (DUF3574) [Caudoviricetes sp.]